MNLIKCIFCHDKHDSCVELSEPFINSECLFCLTSPLVYPSIHRYKRQKEYTHVLFSSCDKCILYLDNNPNLCIDCLEKYMRGEKNIIILI